VAHTPPSADVQQLARDLGLALRLADIGDVLAMEQFRSADLVIETKPDFTPVTEADRSVERALRAELARHRPADAILGEEYGSVGEAHRRWVLDPIDGTKNYVRGVPVWATLVALMEGDEVVLGVVSAPALARRWWASRGNGAFAVDPTSATPRRLQVSRVGSLGDASFSFSDSEGWVERGAAAALQSLTQDTWRSRAYGDFWSHMMVAEGVVDVAAEPFLESYDMAALIPVVQEAGGRVTSFDGGSPLAGGSALTTNGALHADVLRLMGN
jgi:histidinol-phosphatase